MDEEDIIGEVDIDRDILEWLFNYDEGDFDYDDLSDYGVDL